MSPDTGTSHQQSAPSKIFLTLSTHLSTSFCGVSMRLPPVESNCTCIGRTQRALAHAFSMSLMICPGQPPLVMKGMTAFSCQSRLCRKVHTAGAIVNIQARAPAATGPEHLTFTPLSLMSHETFLPLKTPLLRGFAAGVFISS